MSASGIWNASIALISQHGWEVRGIIKNIANQHCSSAIDYAVVAELGVFVPRDNDRYVGANASINF